MKILHVNVVYPKGSTGKIIQEIVNYMGKEQSFVCYGRGNKIDLDICYKFCSELEAKLHGIFNRLGGLQYGGNYLSTKRLINKIISESPQIVHIHCINGYCVNIYDLLDFLAENKIKTVITHHAEFYYTGSCSYSIDCNKWASDKGCEKCPKKKNATGCLFSDNTTKAWMKMKQAFSKFDKSNLRFVAVSPWVRERSLQSSLVNKYDCDVVLNGINTKVFNAKKQLLELNNISDKDIVCLHVTASFDTSFNSLKGGHYIIKLAYMYPEYKFVVVSSYSNISEELPPNIILWGLARSQEELADLYRRANVTVITSRKETFSMIVAESLCCGTPIVGFKAGGPETITIKEYSSFVDYPNIEDLSKAMENQINKGVNKIEVSEKAIMKFDSSVMVDGYIKLYNKLLADN